MWMPGRIGTRVALSVAAFTMLAAPSAAQRMLEPGGASDDQQAITEFAADFASASAGLTCTVTPSKPILNFALRYQAGFVTVLPVGQLQRSGTVLTQRFRVDPDGAAPPVYFQHIYPFPDLPGAGRFDAYLDEGFHIGEGNYTVAMVVKDQQGRMCRAHWRIRHKLKGEERAIAQLLAKGEVEPLEIERWNDASQLQSRPYKVAVMLHATPLSKRRTSLSSYDRALFYSVLTTIFEDTSFAPQSVTAFNLQEQTELFHSTRVDAEAVARLVDRMQHLDLGTVDFKTLRNPGGSSRLLARLVRREVASADPPDAIVFIGPPSRSCNGFFDAALSSERLAGARRPLVFHLNPDFETRLSVSPDAVELFTRALDGKTIRFHDPKGLVRAVREMETAITAASALSRSVPATSATPSSAMEAVDTEETLRRE